MCRVAQEAKTRHRNRRVPQGIFFKFPAQRTPSRSSIAMSHESSCMLQPLRKQRDWWEREIASQIPAWPKAGNAAAVNSDFPSLESTVFSEQNRCKGQTESTSKNHMKKMEFVPQAAVGGPNQQEPHHNKKKVRPTLAVVGGPTTYWPTHLPTCPPAHLPQSTWAPVKGNSFLGNPRAQRWMELPGPFASAPWNQTWNRFLDFASSQGTINHLPRQMEEHLTGSQQGMRIGMTPANHPL